MTLYIIMIALVIIAYQDFKYLKVSVYIMLVLWLSCYYLSLSNTKLNLVISHFIINIAFISFNSVMLFTYLSIKYRKLIQFSMLKNYIGGADLIIWICLAILFSPLNFIVLSLITLILALIVWFLVNLFYRFLKIPLAGIVALVVFSVCGIKLLNKSFDFQNDTWLFIQIVA